MGITGYRAIDGIGFSFSGAFEKKKDAQEAANRTRKKGYLVRIIPITTGKEYPTFKPKKKYALYTRRVK